MKMSFLIETLKTSPQNSKHFTINITSSNIVELRHHKVSCFHQILSFKELENAYNLGQKVGDKFTKLSKIGFSMECFAADFLQFFTKKGQNLAFRWMTGYSPSNPSISGIFLKFPNFLKS